MIFQVELDVHVLIERHGGFQFDQNIDIAAGCCLGSRYGTNCISYLDQARSVARLHYCPKPFIVPNRVEVAVGFGQLAIVYSFGLSQLTPVNYFQTINSTEMPLIVRDKSKIIGNCNPGNQNINIVDWCSLLAMLGINASRKRNRLLS